MSSYIHSELHEDFLLRPSKVDDVLKLLHEIAKTGKDKAEVDISEGVTDTSFVVMQRQNVVKKSRSLSKRNIFSKPNMNQMTFMRQIDVSEEERKKARAERVSVANNFRRLGNAEYRKSNFDKAIDYYTKGLNYINDSPVLFVNRSLCNIKKHEYKRALLDLDHVLNHLDGCCLQAWLYKAGTLKRMNNEAGYEECVDNARRFNSPSLKYIENFLNKMRSEF
ncbi:tetratricopeptide repeat protein 12-like [Drosophila innubila]|uniref:tetratricopeptide repeat protein 12-like n=1 Tax=Drosophila innubila TaxID=198719 RepID=UPI00148BF67A|nr:tetratricopeptide repeat protein 12-like [Drosophila innubila]